MRLLLPTLRLFSYASAFCEDLSYECGLQRPQGLHGDKQFPFALTTPTLQVKPLQMNKICFQADALFGYYCTVTSARIQG